MKSKYETFDRSRLLIKSLSERKHDMGLDYILKLDEPAPEFSHPQLQGVAQRLIAARDKGAARILMMGAHVIKAGASRYVIDLIERGYITHVALNGAGAIHDYELARIGATTESVAHYIRSGEFGLWRETGDLNEIIHEAADLSLGLGENVGRRIEESSFPYKDLSIFAAAYRHSVPATVHVGVGYDIIHEHPNCDGHALGAASYRDFLIFTKSMEKLEGGIMLNFGSAIMGPEVYLKALSMVRNIAHQHGVKFFNGGGKVCQNSQFRFRGERLGVDEVCSRLVLDAGLTVQKFGVSKGLPLADAHHEAGVDAALGQSAVQLESKPVVAADTQYRDLCRSQRGEIIGHRSATSGSDFRCYNSQARDAGFSRGLRGSGIVCAPAVQADVSHHQGPQFFNTLENFRNGHGCNSKRVRCKAGTVAR